LRGTRESADEEEKEGKYEVKQEKEADNQGRVTLCGFTQVASLEKVI